MRHHLELEARDLEARGYTPAEARRRASALFGGVTQAKEAARDGARSSTLADLERSVRLATRVLVRHRTFSVMMIVTLALTIAAGTTAFSIIDALINPVFVARAPERLHTARVIFSEKANGAEQRQAIDRMLARGGATFESYARSGPWRGIWGEATAERGRRTRAAQVASVSWNYFSTLGVVPLTGRLAPPAAGLGNADLAVISDRLQTELFADGEQAVGQTVTLEGIPITVIGVARRYDAVGPLSADAWIFEARELPFAFQRIVRLKPGATPAQARSELERLAERAASELGVADARSAFVIAPLQIGLSASVFHYALLGAGLAVLLIASLNLANLQMVRALGRSAEIATQSALGASRRHILGQLLAENAVIVGLGLVGALVLCLGAVELIRITVPRTIANFVVAPDFNWRMVGFAVAASALAALIVGAIPARTVSRLDLNSLLKQRAGSGTSRRWSEGYGALVVLQIAPAMPLVTAALTLLAFLWTTAQPTDSVQSLGYDPSRLIRAQIRWTRPDSAPVRLGDLAPRELRAIRAVPGVQDAALVTTARPAQGRVTVEDGSGEIREIETLLWSYSIVTPTYFRTLGRTIVRGADFPDEGAGEAAVILDANTAHTLWPRADAIGRAIKFGGAGSDAPWLRVRGVVGDGLSADQRAAQAAEGSERLTQVYRLVARTDTMPASLYKRYEARVDVRAESVAPRVASALRQHLARLDGTTPPRVQLLDEYLGIPQRIAAARFITALFSWFALLALGLACLGVYGIVAQYVSDRRRDLAIRVALGATTRDIIMVVVRSQNVFALLGVAAGLALTALTAGWVGGFTGGSPDSVMIDAAVCALLFVSVAVAAFIPAYRAARVPPMEVLRAE